VCLQTNFWDWCPRLSLVSRVGQLASFTRQYPWSFRHDSKALSGELWPGDQPPGLISPQPTFFYSLKWKPPSRGIFQVVEDIKNTLPRSCIQFLSRLWWLSCSFWEGVKMCVAVMGDGKLSYPICTSSCSLIPETLLFGFVASIFIDPFLKLCSLH